MIRNEKHDANKSPKQSHHGNRRKGIILMQSHQYNDSNALISMLSYQCNDTNALVSLHLYHCYPTNTITVIPCRDNLTGKKLYNTIINRITHLVQHLVSSSIHAA